MSTGYGQAVATKVARRTQAERTEATTGALVDAARELFARDGYDATSLDAVAARASVTKGAVYHHFEGKRQLFEAVFTREVERMLTPLADAYGRKKDPWDAFNARMPDVPGRVPRSRTAAHRPARRIRCDRLGADASTRIPAAGDDGARDFPRAAEAGRIAPRKPGPLAHFLYGAVCEMAMIVARGDDQKAAHREAVGRDRSRPGRPRHFGMISGADKRKSKRAQIGRQGPTWEDGTRVAMDHCW